MTLKSALRKWVWLGALCLLLIAAGTAALIQQAYKDDWIERGARLTNAATLLTSDIMALAEEFDGKDGLRPHAGQLGTMAAGLGADLVVSSLDGTVQFSTAAGFEPSATAAAKVNLSADLHYRLQHDGDDAYIIAFPVIHRDNGIQTGNAIFSLPADTLNLMDERSSFSLLFPVLVIAVGLLGLAGLLLSAWLQSTRRMLELVSLLREHSEAILRGNYSQPAQYNREDEIGELFGVFDQMREELRYLHDNRLRREQAHKELITNISHDLKTPLAVARAYTELMEADLDSHPEPVREYIEVMDVHTRKMSRLIEDLLLHAMNELEQISVKPEEIYSGELFADMSESAARFVEAHGIAFRSPASIPNVLLYGDGVRLEQVMGNLIANAIKHTERGGTISLDIVLESGKLVATVSDTGQGIYPEDMPFLFHRYYQGSAARGEDLASGTGNGLGLSICKHIIEEHGGTIGFRSESGRGAAFTFTLPLSG